MTLTGLRRNYVESVCSAMDSGNIYQLNQLANVKGIGIKTIEKVFEISRKKNEQTSLF